MRGPGRTAAERSATRWLRAFPPRWRRLHEDEVLGLLESVTPAARRLPAGVAANLLASGLAVRWRGRPDPVSWVLYRFFDLPIRTTMDWVADDIDGRWWPVRRLAMVWLVLAVVAGLNLTGVAHGFPTGAALALLAAVPVLVHPTRRHARRWHLLGTEPPPQRIA